MKTSTILWTLCLFFTVSAQLYSSDLFIKQKAHTDGFDIRGQKGEEVEVIQSLWITDKGLSAIDQESTHIIFFKEQLWIRVNHETKTYSEMAFPFDSLLKSIGLAESEADPKFNESMTQSNTELLITSTEEKKKFNTWNCSKYLQKFTGAMGSYDTEIWATQDIQIKPVTKFWMIFILFHEVKKRSPIFFVNDVFQRYLTGLLKTAISGKLYEEINKIKGIIAWSESTMTLGETAVKSSTELLEYKEGDAPAHVFEIPAEYTQTDDSGRDL